MQQISDLKATPKTAFESPFATTNEAAVCNNIKKKELEQHYENDVDSIQQSPPLVR